MTIAEGKEYRLRLPCPPPPKPSPNAQDGTTPKESLPITDHPPLAVIYPCSSLSGLDSSTISLHPQVRVLCRAFAVFFSSVLRLFPASYSPPLWRRKLPPAQSVGPSRTPPADALAPPQSC